MGSPPEFTVRSIVLGAVFGVLFGAANAYLGLRVGLTISTSIPVGLYLPVATMTPVFIGGFLLWIMEKRAANAEEPNERRERGVLFGSGLVGGEGLLGVGVAGYAVLMTRAPEGIGSAWAGGFEPWFPLLSFGFLVWLLWRAVRGRT